jgi:hypothetical protein
MGVRRLFFLSSDSRCAGQSNPKSTLAIHGTRRSMIRLCFQRGMIGLERIPLSALLNDVDQFVGQQVLSDACVGREGSRFKEDLIAMGKRQGIQRLGGVMGILVSMHPHLAEILIEARLHDRAGGWVEGLPRQTQYLVDIGRRIPQAARLYNWLTYFRTIVYLNLAEVMAETWLSKSIAA